MATNITFITKEINSNLFIIFFTHNCRIIPDLGYRTSACIKCKLGIMRSFSFKRTLNFKQDPVSFLGCIGQVAMGKFSKEIMKRLLYNVYVNK